VAPRNSARTPFAYPTTSSALPATKSTGVVMARRPSESGAPAAPPQVAMAIAALMRRSPCFGNAGLEAARS